MCCQTQVKGYWNRAELEAIFKIAGFHSTDLMPNRFIRAFDALVSPDHTWQDGTMVRIDREIYADVEPEWIHFTLRPHIGDHTLDAHAMNALGASILFKTAMTLAERCDGQIHQLLLRGDCRPANGGNQNKLIADYPKMPLRFEQVCLGFQQVLAHGVGDATQGAFDGVRR